MRKENDVQLEAVFPNFHAAQSGPVTNFQVGTLQQKSYVQILGKMLLKRKKKRR